MGQKNGRHINDGSSGVSNYMLHVKTGDKKGAGTDANVFIRLIDEFGNKSQQMKLDEFFRDDFERGSVSKFSLPKLFRSNSIGGGKNSGISRSNSNTYPGHAAVSKIPMAKKEEELNGDIVKIEIWRDNFGLSDDWYVEHIMVECSRSPRRVFHFPLNRWIHANVHYVLRQYDICLPQYDEHRQQRQLELKLKRDAYQYACNYDGLPLQIKTMPDDEHFSNEYKWDIVSKKAKLLAESKLIKFLTADTWRSLNDIKQLYKLHFPIPTSFLENWRSDIKFGRQRICGANNITIKLCDTIPENFAVDIEELSKHIDGHTLSDVIESKRLFYTDHRILNRLTKRRNTHLCSPLALFYLNKSNHLLPIAIQLHQEPSASNPVFYPSDPAYIWLFAKLWYNNADAQYHQSVTHLGTTHILMESVSICTHRHLSPSHPIFKMLAPHFLFLIAINTRGLQKLVNENGWVDVTMTVGRVGMFELMKRAVNEWKMDHQGTLINDLADRGFFSLNLLPENYWMQSLSTEEILEIGSKCNPIPGYHWRNDALLIFEAIKSYVIRLVKHHYANETDIVDDTELQAWVGELVAPKESRNPDGEICGCGIQGVPGNGKLTTYEQLNQILTSIIYTSSVAHATSFVQYDEYAFPPNYPAVLKGKPVTDKQASLSESDILRAIPDRTETLNVMVITKILSEQPTNSLGDFEVQYLYDPESIQAADEFRQRLHEISVKVKQRNKTDQYPYYHLDPERVPNSISI